MLAAELAHVLPKQLFFTSSVGKFVWLGGYLILAGLYLSLAIGSITEALERAQKSNRELQAARASLEQRVEERTRELARRTQYLEATAAIAREAAAVLELQELLERVAGLVRERFALYDAGIYLKDATGEWAVLRAVSTLAASTRSAPGHRQPLEGPALVPAAIRFGESRVRSDVTPLPDLPGARSEAALPLIARGQTIGALDLHSDQPHAFQPQDLAALQTLADQIALAINNAQLFEQAQASLEAERRAYSQQAGEVWQGLVQANANLGFEFRQGALVRLDNQTATPQPHADGRLEYKLPELELPITVRGGAIGTLSAHKPADAGEWTAEEVALVESLTEQLGVALDSARLYQDTQRRAAREQVLGQVTSRIRQTLDMQHMLQSAADEMYRTLALDEVVIQLTPAGESAAADASPGKGAR
jgi:GAF domain-containing protein